MNIIKTIVYLIIAIQISPCALLSMDKANIPGTVPSSHAETRLKIRPSKEQRDKERSDALRHKKRTNHRNKEKNHSLELIQKKKDQPPSVEPINFENPEHQKELAAKQLQIANRIIEKHAKQRNQIILDKQARGTDENNCLCFCSIQ